MIQKMSDQHKINFLEQDNVLDVKKKEEISSEKTIKEISEEQKSKYLFNKDNGMMTSKHVSSARTGSIRDEGGPNKHIKSDSSNTIWNNNKLGDLSKEIDSKTKIVEEKEEISTNRREAEQSRMNDIVESLKSTEQSKSSSVSPMSLFNGSNYKVPKNSISMFDSNDFKRLSEKTEGEKVSDDSMKRKSQVDDSWRNNGKSFSSKEVTNRLFDQFFGESK
jgi:hypothetical protein